MYRTWGEAILAGSRAREFTDVLDCPVALISAFIHGYYTGHTCCDCIIEDNEGQKVFASTGIRIYQGGCVA